MTVLEVQFWGWTATPRMPFILSGNAICMATPSYSLLLGLVGCCLGRPVEPEEVRLGFRYEFDGTADDVETRQRLEYKGGKIKEHFKGSDAYTREFHVNPRLTLWLDRSDWEVFFRSPVGSPSLGRSQDLLKIVSVRQFEARPVPIAKIKGSMLPFRVGQMQLAGQLVQLAEAYRESEVVGGGRIATQSRIFLAVPADNETEVELPNLFQTPDNQDFYLHEWS